MFIRPSKGKTISGFRTKRRPNHHGIDIAQSGKTDILAVANGKVSRSYTSKSYGEVIFVVHHINGQTWETVYSHLELGTRKVKVNQLVKQGQLLGYMGDTGYASRQHLHFELHKGRWNFNKTNAVNPLDFIES
ncbi:M23 family metallopeptidase [Cytobacillus sp. Hm23]